MAEFNILVNVTFCHVPSAATNANITTIPSVFIINKVKAERERGYRFGLEKERKLGIVCYCVVIILLSLISLQISHLHFFRF
ncbi:MAG TPA: hypothetical protein VEH06_12690 [Candidatus Bathyarchaeia archaeon]|nr:hypothetical protein [Candidatus Bathyarchaeia archaeon]